MIFLPGTARILWMHAWVCVVGLPFAVLCGQIQASTAQTKIID